jgi:predicted phage terminase large subunit-like protein
MPQASKIKISDSDLFFLADMARRELARRDFWEYLKLLEPDFYTEDRPHLRQYAEILQKLYRGQLLNASGKPYKKLVVNMPPQHGKTRTLVNFCNWVFGQNQDEKIILGSYNDTTAGDFSRYVRDGIARQKIDAGSYVFRDVFPTVRLKMGYKGFSRWALEGKHFSYLGAGVGGSITSKGATILIVDDPIKNAEEAFNANKLDSIWKWYSGTFLSRVAAEGGEPLEIIVMTRWAKKDLVGRLLADSGQAAQWYILRLEAMESGKMLCPSLLSFERYSYLKKLMPRQIFLANYHQKPIETEGALYSGFKTYEHLPTDEAGNILFERIGSYCDTADEGTDYLCNIIYGEYQGFFYVLDVYYTQDPAEKTEPETARRLFEFNVSAADIESNNGGRAFARNVKRIYYERYKRRPVVRWFHQNKNKRARILSNSARAQELILFPVDWANRWPDFHDDLTSYLKEGTNKHDDAPDALTGVIEKGEGKPKARAVERI